MRFVLKGATGYYSGKYMDKFDLERDGVTDSISYAVIYTLEVKEGEADITPEMPKDGIWEPVPITIITI